MGAPVVEERDLVVEVRVPGREKGKEKSKSVLFRSSPSVDVSEVRLLRIEKENPPLLLGAGSGITAVTMVFPRLFAPPAAPPDIGVPLAPLFMGTVAASEFVLDRAGASGS
jgi:hypothetical protein